MSKLDDAEVRIKIDTDAARRLARAMEQLYQVSGRRMTQEEALAFLEGQQSEAVMPKPQSAMRSLSIEQALQELTESERRKQFMGSWPIPSALLHTLVSDEVVTARCYTVADAMIDGRLLWEEVTLAIAMLPNPAEVNITSVDGYHPITMQLPEAPRTTARDVDGIVGVVRSIQLSFCRQAWVRERTPDRPLVIWCLDPTRIRVLFF